MQNILTNIHIQVNACIYLKDPESSELGKRIVTASIEMIDEMGFEDFTFRKLSQRIESTEASIYRYFESKHKLLVYLTTWYWSWMEYRLVFGLANIESPHDRLEKALTLLTREVRKDSQFTHINEIKLHHIVICEAAKAYLTKEVDQENKAGVYATYKRLVERVSSIILEINPEYKYPHMLISTVIEGTLHQRYFAAHLPRLTDVVQGEDAVSSFYTDMVFKAIQRS